MRGRRPLLGFLILVLAGSAPASAGFGMPESTGLWRMPSARPLPSSRLRLRLLHSYYYQDVGIDSRFHFFHPRMDLGLGLGGFLELGAGLSAWQRRRSVSTLDGELWLSTAGADWSGGPGAADLSVKLSPPLPWARLRLAGQFNRRLPLSSGAPGPEPGGSDLEWRAVLEWRIAEGVRFPRSWLSLMAGRRLDRGPEGSGLPPSIDPRAPWAPFPDYYPAGADAARAQILMGVGFRSMGRSTELFGEGVLVAYHPDLGMDLRENLWQLAFGLRSSLPRGLRLLLAVDMNLSRDDLDTPFEPHFPRLVQSLGISRDWDL